MNQHQFAGKFKKRKKANSWPVLAAFVCACLLSATAGAQQPATGRQTRPGETTARVSVPRSIYNFKVASVGGGVIDFAAFKGKKILIINSPTIADYDAKYAEAEAFYQKYKNNNVVIVGFLDDDFGPAPGSNHGAELNRQRNYAVTYPLAAKTIVKGNENQMAPIYQWLTKKKYNNLKDSEIKWDFQKYLINEQGQLVAVFDPKVKLNSPGIVNAIEK